jgi:hypothetical protein
MWTIDRERGMREIRPRGFGGTAKGKIAGNMCRLLTMVSAFDELPKAAIQPPRRALVAYDGMNFGGDIS